MSNSNKPMVIMGIVAAVLTVLLIGAVIYTSLNPKEPAAGTGTEMQPVEDTQRTVTDTMGEPESVVPLPPPVQAPDVEVEPGMTDNAGDAVVDVLKENEQYQKPANPTVEGDAVIKDDVKETNA